MSELPRDARHGPAMETAVEWFVRQDGRALSPEEQAAFDAWLAADPEHAAALVEVERLWSELDALPADAAQPLRRDRSMAEAAVPAAPLYGPAPIARFWRRFAAAGLVAGLCLFLAIVADLPTRILADARTGVGEIRLVTLPDGSTALLNTASAIAVDYAPGERRVRLLKGEAAFTVAKDGERPFTVETDDGLSTALGTLFLVRRHAAATTVTVIESQVAVASEEEAGGAPEAVLSANQRITYAAGHGLGPIETIDPRAATAWQRGKLIFVDLALGEVIDELNRYHVGQILIVDGALSDMRVNGVFDTGDAVGVLDALEESLSLGSTRLTDLLILLHR